MDADEHTLKEQAGQYEEAFEIESFQDYKETEDGYEVLITHLGNEEIFEL